MKLSTKNERARMVEYADFSGGLNTSRPSEEIAPNELAVAVNVTIDKGTGLLRTVYGADRILFDESRTFDSMTYDKSSKVFLVADVDGNVYSVDVAGWTAVKVGALSGNESAMYASWGKGVLIASGGKLQYFYGVLETIESPPCSGVMVRHGRVWVWHGSRITLSAVGDEHGWTLNTNDASSSQWIDIGYKDDGDIVGVVQMLAAVLVFKENGNIYRIDGQFPNISVTELGTHVHAEGKECCLSIGSGVLVFDGKSIRAVNAGTEYGEMKAGSISEKIAPDIASFGKNTRLRYVPLENSVWILDGRMQFLQYDVELNAYFYRQYHSIVKDVQCVGNDIYMLRENSICRVNHDNDMVDEGKSLAWAFECKSIASSSYILLTRIIADTTPFFDAEEVDQRFWVGGVMLVGSVPHEGTLWDRYYWSKSTLLSAPLEHEPEWENRFESFLPGAHSYIDTPRTYRAELKCVDRRRCLRVRAEGDGGFTMFNRLACVVSEV